MLAHLATRESNGTWVKLVFANKQGIYRSPGTMNGKCTKFCGKAEGEENRETVSVLTSSTFYTPAFQVVPAPCTVRLWQIPWETRQQGNDEIRAGESSVPPANAKATITRLTRPECWARAAIPCHASPPAFHVKEAAHVINATGWYCRSRMKGLPCAIIRQASRVRPVRRAGTNIMQPYNPFMCRLQVISHCGQGGKQPKKKKKRNKSKQQTATWETLEKDTYPSGKEAFEPFSARVENVTSWLYE